MRRKLIFLAAAAVLAAGIMLSGCAKPAAVLPAVPALALEGGAAAEAAGAGEAADSRGAGSSGTLEASGNPEAASTDLQALIDEAGESGTVSIPSGTYTIAEPLRLEGKKQFTLKGEGNVLILGENIDRQIIVIKDCKSVSVENISARHKSSKASGMTKVYEKRLGSVADAEDCGKVSFSECELEGCGVYGIYTVNTREVAISGCYIHHNSWMALGLHGGSGVTNISIENSTISNNADFIEKTGVVNVKLSEDNVIRFNNKEGYNTGR